MKCVRHPDADAAGYCRQCGKALCDNCRRDIRGVIYCEDCLAGGVAHGFGTPDAPNPGVALGLGFIPGVGAIYNGEYVKAFVHLLIFGGLVSILDSGAARGLEPLVGLLTAAFYFYMPFEAFQTAKRRAAGLAPKPGGWEELGFGEGRATPIGPLILIVLGALFLLNNLDIFDWVRPMVRLWPVILIALGAWQLWRRTVGGPR